MARRKKVQENISPAPSHVDPAQQQEALATYYQIALGSSNDSSSQTVSRGGNGSNPGLPYEGRFKEIELSLQPFAYLSGNWIPARYTLENCIKAYWAFPMLRQTVETMCELANSKIYLKGSSKKTKAFVEAWLEKTNMPIFGQQFFREFWRSATCAIVEYDAKMQPEDVQSLDTLYSGSGEMIPLKYTILNPLSLAARSSLIYSNPEYKLILDRFQAAQLKNPQTPEDKAIVQSLDADTKKGLKEGALIEIPKDKLTIILYKAQNYEMWGVPMAFTCLEQINSHLELQKMDMAVARTTDRLLLLITMGKAATDTDKTTINPAAMTALQQMFNTNSISRTLIADYTTKAEWLVPDINKVLGKEKYEVLEKQIMIALNSIFFNENEKFANASIKVQIFIEKLKEAREIFLKKFLQIQINKVCKIINAKSAPEAYFEDISLKDELQWAKLTAQLYGMGMLTAEESLENIQSGKFPTPEESLESQQAFKDLKAQQLYSPVIGNSIQQQYDQLDVTKELGVQQIQQKAQQAGTAGRPAGSKAPQSKKKQTPIGGSEEMYSFAELKEISWAVSDLQDTVDKALKKKFKIKNLDETQTNIARQIVESIIGNEDQEAWPAKVKDYIKTPVELKVEVANEVDELASKHGISRYAASILRFATVK